MPEPFYTVSREHSQINDVTLADVVRTGYKDHAGLSNRSIFYPFFSVGNTFTSGVAEATGSNLISNASL